MGVKIMTITLNEKDFSCSTCGHFETEGERRCRAVSKIEMNPQEPAGSELFTVIGAAFENSQWCSHWKRMGSLNNPA